MNLKIRLMAASAVFLATAPLSTPPAQAAGALAVGQCGAEGYSYNYANMQQAEDAALSHCGRGCKIVLTIEGSCAALATDASRSCGAEGWGSGGNRDAAEDVATGECVNHGGEQCELKRWVCDGG